MNLAAWWRRWWGTPADIALAERRRRFNEERLADLCTCAWTPAPGASSGALRAAYHDAATHEGGGGPCMGRDQYGLRCDCSAFTPREGADQLR